MKNIRALVFDFGGTLDGNGGPLVRTDVSVYPQGTAQKLHVKPSTWQIKRQ